MKEDCKNPCCYSMLCAHGIATLPGNFPENRLLHAQILSEKLNRVINPHSLIDLDAGTEEEQQRFSGFSCFLRHMKSAEEIAFYIQEYPQNPDAVYISEKNPPILYAA